MSGPGAVPRRRARIVVLCPYPVGRAPSQRLKYEQYLDSWRDAGFDVSVSPFWDESAWSVLFQPGCWLRKGMGLVWGLVRRVRDLGAIRGADLVYLHLEAIPLGPPLLERWIARRGIPIVYDIDDLVYLPHSSAANPFMRFVRRLRGRGKVSELIRMAAHTVVCTEHLAAYAREWSDRVTNITSTIDTDTYRPRPHRTHTRGVVVGWSGSHSTSRYLHLLDDVLIALQRDEAIRIKVIGDGNFRIGGATVDAREWSLASEVEDLSEMDIGVYPLPGEEWVHGKSGLKALQYMALEIPTVAQRIGTNTEIISEGDNGLLAGTGDEWAERLRDLIRDPALRRRLGEAGRRTVLARYSVAVHRDRYLEVLRSALATGCPGAPLRTELSDHRSGS